MKSPKQRPMPKLIWDEDYWLHRAEEARAMASEIRNPECRRIMVEIADSYERLAQQSKDFVSAARGAPEKDSPV
jgi:hypothetical protein